MPRSAARTRDCVISEYYCKTTILDNTEITFATREAYIEYLDKTGTDRARALRNVTQCAEIMRNEIKNIGSWHENVQAKETVLVYIESALDAAYAYIIRSTKPE